MKSLQIRHFTILSFGYTLRKKIAFDFRRDMLRMILHYYMINVNVSLSKKRPS